MIEVSATVAGHLKQRQRAGALQALADVFARPPQAAVFLLVGLLLAGCSTLAPLPPADLSAPGWTAKRGQAVWKFGERAPEIVGDLVVSVRADGEMFAQFSKAPLTVAVARADTTRWELDLAMFQRRLAGRGAPDSRFAFFQLARQIGGRELLAPWEFSTETDGRWRLANPRNGEYLEGFWEP